MGRPTGSSNKLLNSYVLEGVDLGSGNFATVQLARHAVTGCKVAVKTIEPSRKSSEQERLHAERHAYREASILTRCSHPNIIYLYETIKDEGKTFLILEYCPGGDLVEYLCQQQPSQVFSEPLSRLFFCQLTAGVKYLHKLGIVHRDLKTENLLLDSTKTRLKICDLGLSEQWKVSQSMRTVCGSPEYLAPELFATKSVVCGPEVDLWSMGIVLYVMLTGHLPFYCINNDHARIAKEAQTGFTSRHKRALHYLHPASCAVIKGLVHTNPKTRWTLATLLNTDYIGGSGVPHYDHGLLAPTAAQCTAVGDQLRSTFGTQRSNLAELAGRTLAAPDKRNNFFAICMTAIHSMMKKPVYLLKLKHGNEQLPELPVSESLVCSTVEIPTKKAIRQILPNPTQILHIAPKKQLLISRSGETTSSGRKVRKRPSAVSVWSADENQDPRHGQRLIPVATDCISTGDFCHQSIKSMVPVVRPTSTVVIKKRKSVVRTVVLKEADRNSTSQEPQLTFSDPKLRPGLQTISAPPRQQFVTKKPPVQKQSSRNALIPVKKSPSVFDRLYNTQTLSTNAKRVLHSRGPVLVISVKKPLLKSNLVVSQQSSIESPVAKMSDILSLGKRQQRATNKHFYARGDNIAINHPPFSNSENLSKSKWPERAFSDLLRPRGTSQSALGKPPQKSTEMLLRRCKNIL